MVLDRRMTFSVTTALPILISCMPSGVKFEMTMLLFFCPFIVGCCCFFIVFIVVVWLFFFATPLKLSKHFLCPVLSYRSIGFQYFPKRRFGQS